MWGIKVSRIALPKEKLTESEWFQQIKASSRYTDKTPVYNAIAINNQYNFSLIKNKQNDTTNTGA